MTTIKAFLTGSLLLAVFLLSSGVAHSKITIDGQPDEPEWAEARIFSDFAVIDPYTLDTPRFQTEAKILSLPEGLAVAFICEQPSGEARTRTTTMPDAASFDSDYVSVMVDFDGTHDVAYEFSVSLSGSYRDGTITLQNRINYDWDGVWGRAVHEEDQRWTAEILLPWSIVGMREGEGDIRQIGVLFQRGLNSKNEKFAFPGLSQLKSPFMSNFAKIEVAKYLDRQLDLRPYVTVLNDLVKGHAESNAGFDLFWKPNGGFQLAATVNPDFGQVESDELVINFSATETFFSDKRPFFTENQGLFVASMPPGQSQLIHTRRIGGPSDDGGGPSDIDGALKIIGSAGIVDYGLFAAWEANDAGRSFYAARLNIPAEHWSLGLTTTYTDRPFLDRTALVNAFNYSLTWEKVFVRGLALMSDIHVETDGSKGYGAYCSFEYNPSDQWRLRGIYTRYDDKLDTNDMGYLARNGFEDRYLLVEFLQTDFPEDSRTAGVTWMLKAIQSLTYAGEDLPNAFTFTRTARMRSGTTITTEVVYNSDGYDDRISRGNGMVYLNDRLKGTLSYSTQRRGMWRKSAALKVFQEGVEDWGVGLEGTVTCYPHDTVTADVTLKPRWSRDWLIWLEDDLLASFSQSQMSADIAATWFPAQKHEVRLRTQWLVIDAEAEQGYRIGADSRLIPSDDAINDFAATSFGLQFRYRYEFKPLSDFYLVYSRGGSDYINNPEDDIWELFGTTTSLRDSDQILLKLRYRF